MQEEVRGVWGEIEMWGDMEKCGGWVEVREGVGRGEEESVGGDLGKWVGVWGGKGDVRGSGGRCEKGVGVGGVKKGEGRKVKSGSWRRGSLVRGGGGLRFGEVGVGGVGIED